MIHAIEIQKFRGIPHLNLENVAPVNIFTGLNGAGKTSVLEAIHIACNGNSPIHLPMLAQIRGQGITPNSDIALRSYFTNLDLRQPPQITLTTEDGDYELALVIPEKATTKVIHTQNGANGVASVLSSGAFYEDRISELLFRYRHPGVNNGGSIDHEAKINLANNPTGFAIEESSLCGTCIRSIYVPTRAAPDLTFATQELSRLRRFKREQELIDLMAQVDNRLIGMDVTSEFGSSTINVDLGLPTMLPAHLLGDGFVRALQLAAYLVADQTEVVVVDEINSGLHYSMMQSVWEQIANLSSKRPFQLFCSTHSDEMLCAALNAFATQPEKLSIYRLDRTPDGGVTGRWRDYATAVEICAAGFDLR